MTLSKSSERGLGDLLPEDIAGDLWDVSKARDLISLATKVIKNRRLLASNLMSCFSAHYTSKSFESFCTEAH